MNRVFQITAPFRVPDGTLVSPFLNSKDSMSDLPFDLLDGFSLAAGIIEPRNQSKIHLMPYLTQVTFIRSGRLEILMKGDKNKDFYTVHLKEGEAVLTQPGHFFQLVNNFYNPCEVLYIVSPAYLFEMSNGKVVYDDAVVLDENWQELKRANWQFSVEIPTKKQRLEAERRIRNAK